VDVGVTVLLGIRVSSSFVVVGWYAGGGRDKGNESRLEVQVEEQAVQTDLPSQKSWMNCATTEHNNASEGSHEKIKSRVKSIMHADTMRQSFIPVESP